MRIPRSSNPVILALVPTGRSAGVLMFAIKPETRNSEASNLRTTQAYGVYFSKPAGGTVIMVYVATVPCPGRIAFSNSFAPQFWQ